MTFSSQTPRGWSLALEDATVAACSETEVMVSEPEPEREVLKSEEVPRRTIFCAWTIGLLRQVRLAVSDFQNRLSDTIRRASKGLLARIQPLRHQYGLLLGSGALSLAGDTAPTPFTFQFHSHFVRNLPSARS